MKIRTVDVTATRFSKGPGWRGQARADRGDEEGRPPGGRATGFEVRRPVREKSRLLWTSLSYRRSKRKAPTRQSGSTFSFPTRFTSGVALEAHDAEAVCRALG